MIEPDMLNQIKQERLERMIINEVLKLIIFLFYFLFRFMNKKKNGFVMMIMKMYYV